MLAVMALSASAGRTIYIDFGDVKPERGRITETDAAGNYWNNVKSSGNNYIYPGTTVDLVDAANVPTGYDILVNTRFMTNGKSAGGLMNPSAERLGDLAVETATEDYLFVEDFQDYNFFTFRGLDINKAYVFHAFGSRANDAVRIGNYSFRGQNEWNTNHQMAGPGCGQDGYNGNNANVAVSDPIFPDENGEITFTIRRVQGMMHINAMKIEETDELTRPADNTPVQSMYIDFGENGTAPNDRWQPTVGADANGHWWNNFYGTTGNGSWVDVIPKGTAVELVNSDNIPTGITATLSDYLKTNGGVNGGIMEPLPELRDLAVASATGDYVYVETSQPSVSVEFTGANPSKLYRIKAFGSRITNETGDRWAMYHFSGMTAWSVRQDFSGRGIGGFDAAGNSVHGNTRNVAVSDFIYPDAEGRLTFTIERKTGLSHLNLLKLEEFDPAVAPEPVITVTSLDVKGSAVENGSVSLRPVTGLGIGAGVFAAYLSLSPGEYTFEGLTPEGDAVVFGSGDDGALKVGAPAYTVAEETVVRLRVDTRARTVDILPIEGIAVKGSIAPEGTVIPYAGGGVWSGEVALTKTASGEYLTHNIYFALNGDEALAIRRVAGSDALAMVADGTPGENIRLNNGTFTISLDLNAMTFGIDAEVNPYRVSVFGSSVANGQGASNFQGYAWLYGNQLKKRTEGGQSRYPLEISGVAIGGNTTRNLLDRYDDVIHDFGRYVLIGLSLGNEGIHGAQNPEAVFNGFRDNMLTLIARLREDGKVPVVVNNYTRGDYNDTDYSYVKRMNLLIHSWDLPSVNVLGAIDDGAGHWAEGYIADVAHPNYSGHQQFMYAIPPSLFDALVDGKPLPERNMTASSTLTDNTVLRLTPEGTVQPFTIAVRVRGGDAGSIFTFRHGSRAKYTGALLVNADGTITYKAPIQQGFTTAESPLADGEWHDIVLTHYFAMGRTFLYIDGVLAGTVDERLTLGEIVFGEQADSSVSRDFSEISLWRSGMNQEEITAHHAGEMLKSSLEVYSPVELTDDTTVLPNRAQTLNAATVDTSACSGIGQTAAVTGGVRVESGDGFLSLTADVPGERARVYTPDGRLVADVTLPATTLILPLSCGLYIVNGIKAVVK